MSIAASGRSSSAWSCCSCISRSSAATSWPSGSITSVPLFIRRFQRRSPTRTAATTLLCERRPVGQRVEQHRARLGRAGPDDQRQVAEFGDVLIGDRPARRGRSARICPDSARWRTAGAPAASTTMVPGRRRSTVACSTQDSVSIRSRACSSEKPRIGSPLLTPSAARSSGSGVLARPSMTMSVTRRPAMAVSTPIRSRSVASVPPGAARLRSNDHDQHAVTASPHADPASGRSSQRCRRSAQLPAGGPVVDRSLRRPCQAHARHAAFSTIQAQSCGKFMPRYAACSGSSEVGVRPGCVLISSSTRRPGSPAVSS